VTSLKGSVSTRIERPDPEEFDPFRDFVDPFNFSAGNPHLKSQTTISFEGGIEHKKKKSLDIATLYYRRNRNGVTSISEDLGDGVLLQVSLSLAGKKLLPQGEEDPMLLVNLGYRHQLTKPLFGFLTAQDALHTYKCHAFVETPKLDERTIDSAKTQAAFVGLTYNFGGKPKEPGFDYSGWSGVVIDGHSVAERDRLTGQHIACGDFFVSQAIARAHLDFPLRDLRAARRADACLACERRGQA